MTDAPAERWRRTRAIFRSRRMAVVFLLGFSSGMPLLLIGQTLQAWTTKAGLDVKTISAMSLVGLAYTFKFAWAPLLDRYALPWLGRRRGWLLVFQLGLLVAIGVLGQLEPADSPLELAGAAVVVAFLAASQDIVVDAWTTDTLRPDERVLGSSLTVAGYRLAMLVGSTFALIAADHVSWHVVYAGMALLMLVGVAATLLAEEPEAKGDRPRTLLDAVVRPFTELWRRLGGRAFWLMLAFAAFYKFGEQFAQTLTTKFFLGEIGFSATDLALANKLVGFTAFAIGGVLGGKLVKRYGLRNMLVAFGVVQALAHVAYLVIAYAGKDLTVFCCAIFLENIAFAMATGAFVASLMAVCSPAVSATQYALLTSLTSVGQRVFGWLAGDVVEAVGWRGFFIVTIALGIPGIILAWFAARVVEDARAGRVAPPATSLPRAAIVRAGGEEPPAG